MEAQMLTVVMEVLLVVASQTYTEVAAEVAAQVAESVLMEERQATVRESAETVAALITS